MADKTKEDGSKGATAKEAKPRTKVEVTRLPPGLSEEQFRTAVNQILKLDEAVDYFYYVAGKSSNTKKVNSFCVMNFKNPQDLFEFAQKFNGHIFVDSKGVEYAAFVEYAPFQRLPKPRKKADARQGTILQDEDYLKFVEALSAPVTPLPSAEAQLEKRLNEEKELIDLHGGKAPAIMSPLLLELLEKKKLRAQKKNKAREDRRKGERRKKRKEAKEKAAAGENGTVKPAASEKRERARKRDAERKERKAKAEKGAAATGAGGGRKADGEGKRRTKAAAADQKAPSWMAIQKQLEPGEIRIATREKPAAPANAAAAPSASPAKPALQRGGGGGGYRNFME